MTTDTYKYFVADTNLSSDYGSAVISTEGSNSNLSKETLCMRRVLKKMNLPDNYTDAVFQIIVASSVPYLRVPDNYYSLVSPHLTTSELASVTSTLPVGGTLSQSLVFNMTPRGYGYNLFTVGDSLTEGAGVSADRTLVYCGLAIPLITGTPLIQVDSNSIKREHISGNWKIMNPAIGGSNYDNSNATSPNELSVLEPYRLSLIYNQRFLTLPLNARASTNIISIWVGTNDIAYDSATTGAIAWTRATTFVTQLRSKFPNVKIVMCTLIKRNELSSLNNRINDFNVLMRANYSSIGVNAVADFEALVPQVNITTGVTTDTLYYTDGVHITALAYSLLAPVFKDALLSII